MTLSSNTEEKKTPMGLLWVGVATVGRVGPSSPTESIPEAGNRAKEPTFQQRTHYPSQLH